MSEQVVEERPTSKNGKSYRSNLTVNKPLEISNVDGASFTSTGSISNRWREAETTSSVTGGSTSSCTAEVEILKIAAPTGGNKPVWMTSANGALPFNRVSVRGTELTLLIGPKAESPLGWSKRLMSKSALIDTGSIISDDCGVANEL